MDGRSWPWKKKSSGKAVAERASASSETAGSQSDRESYKKPTYVQISVESYSHLSGLEDQVKIYEDQVKIYEDQVKICEDQIQTLESEIEELNEKLSAVHSEVTTKDNLAKQHAKVAEEAVSGWEKAEAEALALKNHLETVTLAKLTALDRAAHLDDALKECMRQIRNLKEEHEKKLQDVIITKTKQWDKIRLEFETKISSLEQELLRSDAENAVLCRSLQERSSMLIKISEEKSRAEAEIELLKGNIESCEREINSQKYELHIVAKELEIRNEEKNMSMRSAEVANKQHMEGVKKIAKLEAECQRLRGLVRKKLPGPAALAQMKLEVENLSQDYGDVRLRPPAGSTSSHTSSSSEFTLQNIQKFQKENEFLTERLMAMEEETKMLKEALAKRNSELQTSRSLCAKTASRLQIVESQLQICSVQSSSPKSVVQLTAEGFSNQCHQPSMISMSEDQNDEERSSVGSWATGLSTDQFKGGKNEKSSKTESTNPLELMDDFLEMEKLAFLSNDSNKDISILQNPGNKVSETVPSEKVSTSKIITSDQQCESTPMNVSSFEVESSAADSEEHPLMKLKSRIGMIFESIANDSDAKKVLEDIKHVVQDAHDALYQHSIGCLSCDSEDLQSVANCDREANPDDADLIAEKEIALSLHITATNNKIAKDLEDAISQIHDFVLFVGKESFRIHDTSDENHDLSKKIEEFSATYEKVVHSNTSLADFILDLSHVLSKARTLRFSILGCKGDGETISPDCIDKVALPENKVVQKDLSDEKYHNEFLRISNLEVPDDGNLVLGYESDHRFCKVPPEEFEELKSERDNLKVDLERHSEDLEVTKIKLQETEQLLAEVKSQLASAQKSNSLAETQLKCMAESYRSLEARKEELETQVNLLRAKTETLENELQDEKSNHQEALAKYKKLQMQLQRQELSSSAVDGDLKNNQERDLVAAAEKLAECQETIFLLSKQLKSLRPPTELSGSPYSETNQRAEGFAEYEPTKTGVSSYDFDPADMDQPASPNVHRLGADSPINAFNSTCSPPDAEGSFMMRSPISSKHQKHRSTKSSSSSSSASSTPTPEKQGRGFSRFFSPK